MNKILENLPKSHFNRELGSGFWSKNNCALQQTAYAHLLFQFLIVANIHLMLYFDIQNSNCHFCRMAELEMLLIKLELN